MKYYLSSYKFGNDLEKLKSIIPKNNKIGHINNARDSSDIDRSKKSQTDEIEQLNQLGFAAEVINLKDYFNRKEDLRKKLNSLGGLWVAGGNTFVLRQAMHLSGFDVVIKELSKKDDFLYAGYSAGVCVLSKSLKSLFIVDKPYSFPYPEMNEPIWEGLGFFDYDFMPHYDSDHSESEDIGKTINYCIENKILFKAIRDGDVIIIE